MHKPGTKDTNNVSNLLVYYCTDAAVCIDTKDGSTYVICETFMAIVIFKDYLLEGHYYLA